VLTLFFELEYFQIADAITLTPCKKKIETQNTALYSRFVNNIRLITHFIKLIYFCSMQIQVLKSKIHRVKVTGRFKLYR
jgi:hypothetical protein